MDLTRQGCRLAYLYREWLASHDPGSAVGGYGTVVPTSSTPALLPSFGSAGPRLHVGMGVECVQQAGSAARFEYSTPTLPAHCIASSCRALYLATLDATGHQSPYCTVPGLSTAWPPTTPGCLRPISLGCLWAASENSIHEAQKRPSGRTSIATAAADKSIKCQSA